MTVVLGASDIGSLIGSDISSADVVDAVQEIHRDLGAGAMVQPAPVALTGVGDAVFLPMAVRSDWLGLVAVKLMADIPDNSERGLPTQRSTIVVTSSVTGECVAVVDGMAVTRARTAATSVVATRLLARPDGSTLGLVGLGNLAIEHARMFARVRPFDRIVVWSRSSATVDRFLDEVGPDLPRRCVIASGPQEVAEESDVLCTLTPSIEPVVLGSWLHAGQHVNAVGARPRPTHREVDGAAMARATVVVDSRATALAKSGDLLEAVADGALRPDVAAGLAELGEVVVGTAAGRRHDDEITLFDSVGLGAQDLAVAAIVIQRAREQGLGLPVALPSVETRTAVAP